MLDTVLSLNSCLTPFSELVLMSSHPAITPGVAMVDQRSYVIVTTWVLEQWQLGVLSSPATGTLLGSHPQLTEASTEQAPKGGGALAPRSCSPRRLVHGPAPEVTRCQEKATRTLDSGHSLCFCYSEATVNRKLTPGKPILRTIRWMRNLGGTVLNSPENRTCF